MMKITDLTIEELEKQYVEMTEKCKTLEEHLQQKRQDEKDKKKAQLALEKNKRKEEVDEALERYYGLLNAYIQDYGEYSRIDNGVRSSFWWF